jgi:hypothetical protein
MRRCRLSFSPSLSFSSFSVLPSRPCEPNPSPTAAPFPCSFAPPRAPTSSPGAPPCPQKLPHRRNQPEVAGIAAAHRCFPAGTEVRRRPIRRPPVTPTPASPADVLRVSSSPFTPAPHPFPAVDERLRPASHASLCACSAQGEANIALACLASVAVDMDPGVHRSVTVGHFYPSVKSLSKLF